MDTFCEQIVSVKKTDKNKVLCALVYIVAIIVSVLCVLGALKNLALLFLFVLIIAGVWFLAYKLVSNFNVEYEYIITNGDVDIDVIINKSRRKRIASFQCKNIEAIQKYSFCGSSNAVVCCNEQDEAYLITARDTSGKVLKVVIAPNEKIKSGIVKFLPRILVKDAFI